MDTKNVKDFLLQCESKKISPQTRNMFLSAIKFYYTNVVGLREKIDLHSAKKAKSLPVVFSQNEIDTLLKVLSNPKHRLILSFSYGAGLRVSEVRAKVQGPLELKKKNILAYFLPPIVVR